MPVLEDIIKYIEEKNLAVTVKRNEPLSKHTTFKIGGPVCAMLFPEDTDSAIFLIGKLHELGISPYFMGNGSNILADDKLPDIYVINTTNMKRINLLAENNLIEADCGISLSLLTSFALDNGLTGAEFLTGIPGTLGGAAVMNAGAYGGEIKDIIVSITAYNPHKGIYTISKDEADFSYRHSIFSKEEYSGDIVLSTVIRLAAGNRSDIEKTMNDITQRRRAGQPLDMPSAGSTFKRPQGDYAAALIDRAGLKGYTIGGARVSEKHAGFIINTGSATFADVTALIGHVTDMVEKQSGVRLEPEVKIWT